MGKKYVMFVDERGFLNTDTNENITMVGVIFEYNYCIDSESNQCELRWKLNEYKERMLKHEIDNIYFDDLILNENVYKRINMAQRKNIVNELPALLKDLKFTIISSVVRSNSKSNESYSIVTEQLLKKFYSFIMRKNGESGGIIMEAKDERVSYIMQQNFFNIYNERNMNLSILGNIQDIINTFMICEKSSKAYGACIELSNVLNNIIYRVSNGYREIDRKLISYLEYGSRDRIFDSIKHKIYKDAEMGISSLKLQAIHNNNVESFNKELRALKEQLMLKDIRISEKEKEINDLTYEVQLLSQQLEEVITNSRDENIIARMFSDIDVRIKNSNKIAAAAQNQVVNH